MIVEPSRVTPGRPRKLTALAFGAAFLAACSYQNPLSEAGKAFRSGAASWGTMSLGQTYAATLREGRKDCFLTLFDVDTIAGKAYESIDATTRNEALKLVDSVFDDQRRLLATAFPGRVVSQADGGNEQVVLPPVHRAYRSPLDDCPNHPPKLGTTPLEGTVEGMLRIEFPYRDKVLEMRARLSQNGSRVISIPVMRDLAGTIFQEPEPAPLAPPPPPPPATSPAPPLAPPVQGQPLP